MAIPDEVGGQRPASPPIRTALAAVSPQQLSSTAFLLSAGFPSLFRRRAAWCAAFSAGLRSLATCCCYTAFSSAFTAFHQLSPPITAVLLLRSQENLSGGSPGGAAGWDVPEVAAVQRLEGEPMHIRMHEAQTCLRTVDTHASTHSLSPLFPLFPFLLSLCLLPLSRAQILLRLSSPRTSVAETAVRVACPGCRRKFNPAALARHAGVCKAGPPSRKKFVSQKPKR